MNEYLKTMYRDYAIRVKSINTYLKMVKDETGEINQATYEWIGKRKNKFDILKKFQDSRQKSAPATEFAVELPPTMGEPPSNDEDIKKVDADIKNSEEQLNYAFEKTLKHLQFVVQSFQDLEDIVNKVGDYYDDMYGAM